MVSFPLARSLARLTFMGDRLAVRWLGAELRTELSFGDVVVYGSSPRKGPYRLVAVPNRCAGRYLGAAQSGAASPKRVGSFGRGHAHRNLASAKRG